MAPEAAKPDRTIALVNGILDDAFFAPLAATAGLAGQPGQPGLLTLEDEELFDLFVRCALAAETLHPEEARGRTPLAWVSALTEPGPVLAQAMASIRHDRPFLFHKMLLSLPAVREGKINPGDFELIEDFLAQALAKRAGMKEAAGGELETLYARALKAAGLDPEDPPKDLAAMADSLLAAPEALRADSDMELRAWLAMGEGLEGLPRQAAPGVLAEVWRRWVRVISCAEPDLGLLARILPDLNLTVEELALYAPPDPKAGHIIEAVCPYCQATSALKLGREIEPLHECEHLIYVGTTDELHIMNALAGFDLGEDFRELMSSYYNSSSDLDLFSTITNDMAEMLKYQGRLSQAQVFCQTAPRAFYNLLAYFKGPGQNISQPH